MTIDGGSRSDPSGSVWRLLLKAERPLLTTHANADADAVASVLALEHVLRCHGATPTPVLGDGSLPPSLAFVSGADRFISPDAVDPAQHDTIVLLDCADMTRLGPLYDLQREWLESSTPIINIDHHITNPHFGAANLVDPEAAATSEVLARLFMSNSVKISPDVATALLAGIYGDTLGLRTPSTTPRTLRIVAELLENGGDPGIVVDRLFREKPFSTVKLWGEALSRAQIVGQVIWTEITPELLANTGAVAAEGEGIVNFLAGTNGTLVGILCYEQPDSWRVSLRSIRDDIDVAEIARGYGGGGHSRAAGCTLPPGTEHRDAFIRDVAQQLAAHASPST